MRRRSALSTSSSRRRVGGGGGVIRTDLPWNPPTAETMRTGPWVGAHYFLTFPLAYTFSQDSPTAPDVDTRWSNETTPNSTANAWWRFSPYGNANQDWGGEVRDRPIPERAPRPTITSPTDSSKKLDFRILDKITECRQAMAALLDGFWIDLLDVPVNATEYDLSLSSTSGGAPLRWRQAVEMVDAVAEVRRQSGPDSFHLGCMPDASTNATKAPAGLLCDAIKYIEDRNPGIWLRRNGALILAPYQPEVAPAGDNSTFGAGAITAHDYWRDVIAGLKTRGFTDVFFMPVYSRNWTSTPQHPHHQDLTQGFGRWGDRSPDTTNQENDQNRRMYYTMRINYPGNIFLAPVSKSDERPNQGNYYESDHERQLAESWKTAQGDGATDSQGRLLHPKAEYVQLITWNDDAEGAHIQPSKNNGWAALDLNMWDMIRYKTGFYPVIVRDALYLTHRIQPTDDAASMTYSGGQIKLMSKRTGGTANQNTVGVVCFLTAPASVSIDVGGTITTTAGVPAGRTVLRVNLLPFGTGLISCSAVREGITIAGIGTEAARTVKTTLESQDLAYRWRKSLPDIEVI